MSIQTLLIIILVILAIGVFPSWGYSRSWGHGPSSLLFIAVIVLVVLLLTGRL